MIGEDYKGWKNEFIGISGGTGSGKTSFCLNVLAPWAGEQGKKMLYLSNRTVLKKQKERYIKKLQLKKVVYSMSYQSLETRIRNNQKIPDYDFIICDECHYFIEDSLINNNTDQSFLWSKKQAEHSVVIYLSATADEFFRQLKESGGKMYHMERDFSHIEKKIFSYKRDDLFYIIDTIISNSPGKKMIAFVSINRMKELFMRYGDQAAYFFSKNANVPQELKRKRSEEPIQEQEDGSISFSKRMLFTTVALDNGIDIFDRNLDTIICELSDTNSIIQAIGRKRKTGKDDKAFLFLCERKNVNWKLNGIRNILEQIKLFSTDKERFMCTYQHDKNIFLDGLFFPDMATGEIMINEMKRAKYLADEKECFKINENGLVKYIISKMGDDFTIIEIKNPFDKRIAEIKDYENRPLYRNEQDEIKKIFETMNVHLRGRSIQLYNGALSDIFPDYNRKFTDSAPDGSKLRDRRRKLEDGRINQNRDKSYWLLE